MNVWKEEVLFSEWFDQIKNSSLLPLNKVLKTWRSPKGNLIYSTHSPLKELQISDEVTAPPFKAIKEEEALITNTATRYDIQNSSKPK